MDDEQLTPYGAAIRRARLRKGWDQETLGRALGKDKGWVSREEGGRPNLPDVGLYRKMCETLGIRLRDLLEAKGYIDPDEPETGVAYVIREDDPRAALLAMVDGLADADVAAVTGAAGFFVKALRQKSGQGDAQGHPSEQVGMG